jgi:hypothetical protein
MDGIQFTSSRTLSVSPTQRDLRSLMVAKFARDIFPLPRVNKIYVNHYKWAREIISAGYGGSSRRRRIDEHVDRPLGAYALIFSLRALAGSIAQFYNRREE